MGKIDNRADVDKIKAILLEGWNYVRKQVPDERVYAFGIYTNEVAQSMAPFLMGEQGLDRVASRYVEKHSYKPDTAADELRWSTADSPYQDDLFNFIEEFRDRKDVWELNATAMAREVNYRLNAACDALNELDAEGLFGTGDERNSIVLYIEGGDVNREWLLKWAKKVNPKPVYEAYAKIGAPDETLGTFTEFGTKKVYETKQYAISRDRKLFAAATSYHLFVFDMTGPKQLAANALPNKEDYVSLGGVAMSADGKLIAVIPFGGGKGGNACFLVRGEKFNEVQTITLNRAPCAVAVSPGGEWIAVTDQASMLHTFSANGAVVASHTGHKQWPRAVAFSNDGSLLATADGKSIIIRNTRDWAVLQEVFIPIDTISFDPTGGRLIGSCQYSIRNAGPRAASIINVQTGDVERSIVVKGYRIEIVRWSPDGKYLACAMREDTDKYAGTNVSVLIDVETGEPIDWLKADFEQVRDFAFLAERGEIAVAVFGHTRRPLVLWKPKVSAVITDKSGT